MEPIEHDSTNEQLWHALATQGSPDRKRLRQLYRLLPANPRCKNCYAPFQGIGGTVMRLVFHKRPSHHNPLVCNVCEDFAARHPGGTEIEMAMLFADVRGSTTLAEQMRPSEFSRLINRFYSTALDIIAQADGVVDRLVGDEMIGYFLPGFSGPDYTCRAIEAAQALLKATGHASLHGPWIPVGIGVHQGVAYFGTVGEKDGTIDVTALGDAVNATSRLASSAGAGEILISDDAYHAAGLERPDLERRNLRLKGRIEPMSVRVMNIKSGI